MLVECQPWGRDDIKKDINMIIGILLYISSNMKSEARHEDQDDPTVVTYDRKASHENSLYPVLTRCPEKRQVG